MVSLLAGRACALLLMLLVCLASQWAWAAEEVVRTPGGFIDDRYRLGTGDAIRVEIFGEETLADMRIGDEGVLPFPYLGEVKVAGLTPRELRDELRDRLVPDYFVDPDIIVSVREYRNFFVYGEVGRPGGYPFEPGLTVGKALALAGGLSERGSRRRIFLVRDDNPERERIRAEESFSVRPGDVLTVEASFF